MRMPWPTGGLPFQKQTKKFLSNAQVRDRWRVLVNAVMNFRFNKM
jgi:hypothetical protein